MNLSFKILKNKLSSIKTQGKKGKNLRLLPQNKNKKGMQCNAAKDSSFQKLKICFLASKLWD